MFIHVDLTDASPTWTIHVLTSYVGVAGYKKQAAYVRKYM